MTASRTAKTIPFFPFISLSFRSLRYPLRHFRSTAKKFLEVPDDAGNNQQIQQLLQEGPTG
jgi:hypothetical protein